MINEHVFMNLVSLDKKSKLSLILRSGKVARVSGASTTCTNWDNQCRAMSGAALFKLP